MNKKIHRNYLEINSIKDLKESDEIKMNCSIILIDSKDFQINKFFYKNIGKNHNWVDRLSWSEQQWIKHTKDQKLKTYVMKVNEDLEREPIAIDIYGNEKNLP